MVVHRDQILEKFELFRGDTGGLDSWLSSETPERVFVALQDLENQPLTRPRFNQLLTLSHEAPVSQAFFNYYWLSAPQMHPYDVKKIPGFDERFCDDSSVSVRSLDQLYWGLYRFYVDALLYFGNVRTAFQRLRSHSDNQLDRFFRKHRFDADDMRQRGAPIRPNPIEKGERYLISEMACKSLEAEDFAESELAQSLVELYRRYTRGEITIKQILDGHESLEDPIADRDDLLHKFDNLAKSAVDLFDRRDEGQITAADLLEGASRRGEFKDIQLRLYLTADEFLDAPITDEDDLLSKIESVHRAYRHARSIALKNTESYLSMVGDLDVYVATSMRTRQDFIAMADFCDDVFGHDDLREFNLRYFDPTLSAAQHHEDKGLIECLMVERAKVLVLQAGSSDSYGKDAEAAMALSLGKPVIIHANSEDRRRMFSETHPLARLVNFRTGVAVGAMVAGSPSQAVELLQRIFAGDLEYTLHQRHPKYLVLEENVTGSVVRLQTSDDLIRETFWNHYQSDVR